MSTRQPKQAKIRRKYDCVRMLVKLCWASLRARLRRARVGGLAVRTGCEFANFKIRNISRWRNFAWLGDPNQINLQQLILSVASSVSYKGPKLFSTGTASEKCKFCTTETT
ncbi:hypothetical protein O181_033639 [Austropuccinia psidii MF-1]|uniref:Uncharacterized protein n=1 Tax=Austropuccinia psidii MF-1 TaxID=1389203 RepID=A0A9Q3CZI7_9BASI|nr:hypothetical protein [Austropuccinia psidii MF-1]